MTRYFLAAGAVATVLLALSRPGAADEVRGLKIIPISPNTTSSTGSGASDMFYSRGGTFTYVPSVTDIPKSRDAIMCSLSVVVVQSNDGSCGVQYQEGAWKAWTSQSQYAQTCGYVCLFQRKQSDRQ